MALHTSYNPSVPEVLALVALIPDVLPPPPSISHLLEPFLSLVQTPWLQNFLFTTDPIHLPHLISPTLSDISHTTAFTTSRIEPLTPHPSLYLPESHHIQGRHLYTPSLTSPTLTLGFGMMEIIATEGNFWQSTNPTCAAAMTFRFIRHNPTNLLLHVFDTPCDDAVLLDFSKPISSTSAQTVTAMFTLSKLISLLSANPTVAQLESAAFFIQDEVQRRSCPNCAAPPGAKCPCPLFSAVPNHPVDSAHFKASMSVHNGVFEATASKRLFPRHSLDRHCVLGSRTWMTNFADRAFVKRVGDWALADYFNSRKDSPMKSLPIIMEGPKCYEVFRPPTLNEDFPVSQVAERGGVGKQDVVDISADALSNVPQLLPPSVQPADDLWWVEACYTAIEGDNVEFGIGSIDAVSTDLYFKEGERSTEGKMSDGNISMRGAVRIESENVTVPPQVDKVVEPPQSVNNGVDHKLLARQLKAQRRRERNRLCAQRSNIKAKENRDRLLADLKNCREQVDVLRSKELKLRQENLKLRKSVTENK